MPKMEKKLVIIGMDGASWYVLNKLMKKGKLKNLRKLKNKKILKSCIPPVTAPAWSCFQTGKWPGKTGLYKFVNIKPNWKMKMSSSKDVKPFWDKLSKNKIKSCIINVPLTYPVKKINGYLISGMLTPSENHEYTYPSQLKQQLNKIGYKIEPTTYQKSDIEIKQEVMEALEKRIKTGKLMLKKQWDFFLLFFRATDLLQHYFWDEKIIQDCYEKIDSFIGYVMKKYPNLIIMSDHGFEKVDKAFNANAWLKKENYLFLNKTKSKGIISKKLIYKIFRKLNLEWLRRRVPRKFKKLLKQDEKEIGLEEAILQKRINMKKTKAMAIRAVKCANIYINNTKMGGTISEEESEKLKKEISEKLKTFFKKNNFQAKIYLQEQLYGKNPINAPDIVIYMPKGYDTNCNFSSGIWTNIKERLKAEHNTEAVFLTNKEIKGNPEMVDFAPSILNFFNIKPDKDMDGKIIFN